MATRESIAFDLNRALRQADEIDSVANNLKRQARDKLDGSMQMLSRNWQGTNANAYIEKGNTLRGNVSSYASQLNGIASDVRTIAHNIYEAEMEALRIAEERERNGW